MATNTRNDSEIGEIAKRVQTTLGCRGEMTPLDIEITVDVSTQLLDCALGWLACEDKVEFLNGDAETRVRLKLN